MADRRSPPCVQLSGLRILYFGLFPVPGEMWGWETNGDAYLKEASNHHLQTGEKSPLRSNCARTRGLNVSYAPGAIGTPDVKAKRHIYTSVVNQTISAEGTSIRLPHARPKHYGCRLNWTVFEFKPPLRT